MCRRRIAWFSIVFFIGCGDDTGQPVDASDADGALLDAALDDAAPDAGPPMTGPVSGTRLKAGWIEGSDGSRLFAGMRDSGLADVPCSPQVADDGTMRCLPTITVAPSVFADAACTQPVASWFRQCLAAPSYARTVENVSCVDRATIREVGPPMTPTALYRMSPTGTCVVAPIDARQDYLLVGDVVPAAAFVAMTSELSDTPSALELVYQIGADGSRVPVSGWDEVGETSCIPWNTADGIRCGPTDPDDLSPFSLFSDDACTARIAQTSPTCAPEIIATYQTDPVDKCAPPFSRFYRPGAPLDPPPAEIYFSPFAGFCSATTVSPDLDYRPMTDEIVPASLVALTPAVQPSTRLEVALWSSADGFLDLSSNGIAGVFDPLLDATCFPTLMSDGTRRCAPQGEFTSTYFTDDACTTPIDLVTVFDFGSTCGAPAPAFARVDAADACVDGSRYYHVGAAFTDAVYLTGPGGCELDRKSVV